MTDSLEPKGCGRCNAVGMIRKGASSRRASFVETGAGVVHEARDFVYNYGFCGLRNVAVMSTMVLCVMD
jgi:hypothetical protein